MSNHSCARHVVLIHIPISCMKLSQLVTELHSIQECLENNQSKRHNSESKTGEQSFLCATCGPEQIHIPKMLHEDIPKGYRVMECTRMFGKKQTDGQTVPCHNMSIFQKRAFKNRWPTGQITTHLPPIHVVVN